jgi:FG-GAP-like repeat/FG-GAP repeat
MPKRTLDPGRVKIAAVSIRTKRLSAALVARDSVRRLLLRMFRLPPFRVRCREVAAFATVALLTLVVATGCRRPEVGSAAPPTPGGTVETVDFLRSESIGAPVDGQPWIAHVAIVDLDRDGRNDALVCDAKKNQVGWLRQSAAGTFEEIVLGSDLRGPVHATADDLDGDRDLDVLVASMGVVFPNNEKIGAVIWLENDGAQHFTPRVLLDHVARVTDVAVADFNGDGRRDLAVAQFGYDQGEIRWMENLGGGKFKSHILLSLSGAINVCIADCNDDDTPDIVALVSQQWEEVYLFANDGQGGFTKKVIAGSTNEDFGSSGISLCDLNRDGRPDVLYSNGDGFDYAEPGPRPWHGVQWLENTGGGFFRLHRIGDLPGAYSPAGTDLDGDGDTDVVAVSGFNDWANPRVAAMMWFRNDGARGFTPCVLAHVPTHLLTVAAGDFDGDGRPELLTGGFHAYPPYDHMSRVMVWRRAAGR